MKTLLFITIAACVIGLIASSSPNENKPQTGSDSHGCFASAGYSWCEKEGKCVRPWELAQEKGLDTSPKSFHTYCTQSNMEGGTKDNHGCLTGAGYSWCAKEEKCIRPWELSKEKGIATTPAAINKYCSTCIASAGYTWCEKEQKCIRPWELATLRNIANTPESVENYCSGSSVIPVPLAHPKIGGSSDTHGCIGSAGYVWCAAESKCVRPWEVSKDKGFENTAINIQHYCSGLAVDTSRPIPESSPAAILRSGIGAAGAHGCISSAGYTWCETEGKCVRPWELASEKNIQNTAAAFASYCSPAIGSSDSHGCVGSAGYTWCEKEGKCVRPWELARVASFENTRQGFIGYCGEQTK